jgi:adenine phosphoribosyltransferase
VAGATDRTAGASRGPRLAGPDDLRALIREIPDFPEPGVGFKDITTLLSDPAGFATTVDLLAGPFRDEGVELVVGIEARGFVFSAPVAHALGAGLVPIRKPGKLPSAIDSVTYELEYGGGTLEIHADAIPSGSRCLIVDDVLATGGTARAGVELVERQGGVVVGLAFLAELAFLGGRQRLGSSAPVVTLINYDD